MRMLAFILALFALGCIVGHVAGCKPAEQPDKFPAYCYDRDDFTKVVTDCAIKAPSREASRACRAEAHKACGITMTVSERSAAP